MGGRGRGLNDKCCVRGFANPWHMLGARHALIPLLCPHLRQKPWGASAFPVGTASAPDHTDLLKCPDARA